MSRIFNDMIKFANYFITVKKDPEISIENKLNDISETSTYNNSFSIFSHVNLFEEHILSLVNNFSKQLNITNNHKILRLINRVDDFKSFFKSYIENLDDIFMMKLKKTDNIDKVFKKIAFNTIFDKFQCEYEDKNASSIHDFIKQYVDLAIKNQWVFEDDVLFQDNVQIIFNYFHDNMKNVFVHLKYLTKYAEFALEKFTNNIPVYILMKKDVDDYKCKIKNKEVSDSDINSIGINNLSELADKIHLIQFYFSQNELSINIKHNILLNISETINELEFNISLYIDALMNNRSSNYVMQIYYEEVFLLYKMILHHLKNSINIICNTNMRNGKCKIYPIKENYKLKPVEISLKQLILNYFTSFYFLYRYNFQ